MARFYWDDDTSASLVRTKEFQEITGSQEFMLSDPVVEPYLYQAQNDILQRFSDKDIIFKIKGNISKLMTLESGLSTPVPAEPLLRGLDSLVRLAEQRHSKSPWDHESLEPVSKNMIQFLIKLKNHPQTPKDVLAPLGEEVGLETITFQEILSDIFGVTTVHAAAQSMLESGQKIALESAISGIKNATAKAKAEVTAEVLDA